MKPIYEPKGKAKEYGDLAINIYTGCPHRCFYCFAPNVLHKQKEQFHSCVEPRKDIVNEVKKQLEKEQIKGKLIHLCFTCDPYPIGYDTTPTREIIKAIKDSGNNVQILTKNGLDAIRDFELLDENDWFGVTIECYDYDKNLAKLEDKLLPSHRMYSIYKAHDLGIKTWVSFEPVLNDIDVLECIEDCYTFIDKVKIGKLNYYKSDINWKDFGIKAENLCKSLGIEYYIKDSLREEMNK